MAWHYSHDGSKLKPPYLIAVALLLGLLASFGAARWISGRTSSGPLVVVAASTLNPGHAIALKDLQEINWPTDTIPSGTFSSRDKLIGRVLRQAVHPNELIMTTDLAAEGSRGGLAATIEPGKRAITVRVNDVIAVAGFAFPGSYVDVLVSAKNLKNEQFSKIVLSRVKILAIAQDTSSDPTKPKVVNAVTLELTPGEAEALDLARSVGTLSLVLRNEMDNLPVSATGALLEELMQGTSVQRDNSLSVPSINHNVAIEQKKSTAPTPPKKMIEMRGTASKETILGGSIENN